MVKWLVSCYHIVKPQILLLDYKYIFAIISHILVRHIIKNYYPVEGSFARGSKKKTVPSNSI